MGSRNLAGGMGRWSAIHRKTAIFGWLAFVLVAVGVGMQFHQVKPENSDLGNGQSKAAAKAYESADFPDEFGEQVLIAGRGVTTSTDPQVRAAVADVTGRLDGVPHVAKIKSPFSPGNAGQISKDGHSVLVTFEVTGDKDMVKDRVAPAVAATEAAQKAHPEVLVGQFGA